MKDVPRIDEQFVQAMLGAMVDLVFVFDEEGRYRYYHCRSSQDLLLPPDELMGRRVEDVLPGEIGERFARAQEDVRRGKVVELEYALPMPGGVCWYDARLSPILEDGQFRGSVAVVRDITEYKRVQDALLLQGVVFEHTLEGIFITDTEGTIRMVNPAFTAITGYTSGEAVGRKPRLLRSECQPAEFYEEMWTVLLASGQWQGEIWNRRKNGETYPEFLTINAVYNEAGTVVHYIASFTDLSNIKFNEERLIHQTYHDSLTELPNRELFSDRLRVAIRQVERDGGLCAVIFLDIDNFKQINSFLGYAVGDELLQQVAARLRSCVRDTDTVARISGDEFVLLMVPPALSHVSDAGRVVQRIDEAFKQPFICGDKDLHLSVCMGVALCPSDGIDEIRLLTNADTAMHHAKEHGKGCSRFYSGEMNVQVSRRMNLEMELHRALDNDQFVIHYQPVVEVQSGNIVGAEALIRWHHPERGLVSPAEFIPLAEETGIITPLTRWVLRRVCRDWRALHALGIEVMHLAVNVSAREFERERIINMVDELKQETGLVTDFLSLELTENSLIDRREEIVNVMHRLKGYGVTFSIDDFGTGYSSLSYLKQFPVDMLKIDRSFVVDLPQDSDSAGIARAVIGVAHSLGMRLVAEGVETREQLDFLRDAGCEFVQGYYFSRPVPLDEFAALISDRGRLYALI